nr:DUF3500 domain-containing protein [uncultured Sphingomonas sp.]
MEEGETVDLAIKQNIKVDPADATGQAITAAASAFLATLSDAQRKAVVFPFTDNAQRAKWSNFPSGIFPRAGLRRGDLNAQQSATLDRLLSLVLSDKGLRNARLQMAADDALKASESGSGGPAPDFGSANYNVSFLGVPSNDRPWMLQFGGHHLAINVTFAGSRASFSPMLTGGQPLTVNFNDQKTYITKEEVDAARALLASLNPEQKTAAVRGPTAIQLVLGPGEYGTTIAPEGVRASAMTDVQKQLLLNLIQARIGQLNARDASAKMAEARQNLSNTYFGWWGPEQPYGAAYYRITAPHLVLEYSPQKMGDDDPTEHAHNMYRDPTNDYGSAWIKAQ